MRQRYLDFLAGKAPRAKHVGIEPGPMPAHLFDFQAATAAFMIRAGRAARFLDTGLGKGRTALECLRQAGEATNGITLHLVPLAVARQIEKEGKSLGYEINVIKDQSEVRGGINVCNYDRLDRLDERAFGAVSLDESSILKSFTGATTRALIDKFSETKFKFAWTATPAPNDHMELGQHAEFLSIMPSNEMLMRWFISDQTQIGRYRLKSHGESSFWDWMASWSRCAETPADLGFDASRFVLPELTIVRHVVAGDVRAPIGVLFANDLSATNIHDVKRQTADARARSVADIVGAETGEPWVIWCDTDYEADALMKAIPYAVEIRGSHSIEKKENTLSAFADGSARVLITKSSITGYGLNWQHCARMAFVGRSFSYESWYQAVRRCWRFGQTRPVIVHLAVAEGEDQIGRVIARKSNDHSKMKRAMSDAMARNIASSSDLKVRYNPTHVGKFPSWLISAA